MVSVSANRTHAHFGKIHYCRLDGKMIDKTHINACVILKRNLQQSVTKYNEMFGTTSTHDLSEQQLTQVVSIHRSRRDDQSKHVVVSLPSSK
jgi:hypothetical protein